MKLLIDIPDWLYNDICNNGIENRNLPELYYAIYTAQIAGAVTLSEAAKEYIKRDKEALKDFHIQNVGAVSYKDIDDAITEDFRNAYINYIRIWLKTHTADEENKED